MPLGGTFEPLGEDSAYKRGGDACQKSSIKPLKETDLGMAQAFWILFTVGNVDRDIGRYSGRHSGRYSGRQSVDSRSTVSRYSVASRSTVGRQSVDTRSTVYRQSVDIAVDSQSTVGR